MDTPILMLFISQIMALAIIYRSKGLADLSFILPLVFFFYGNSYLIDYLLFNSYVEFIDETFFEIYIIFSSFIFLFALGAALNHALSRARSKIHFHERVYFKTTPIRVAYLTLLAIYAYYFINLYSIAISDRNQLYLNQNTLFSAIKIILPFYFILIWASSRKKINAFYLFSFIVFCASELFIFGDRRGVASALVSIFILHNRYKIIRINPKLILFSIIFIASMVYIERTRYGGDFFANADYSYLNPAVTELGAPWLVGLKIYNDIQFFTPKLDTFINSLLNLVPHVFWDDRPPGASALFVQEYFPDIAAQGGGFAYSFILELIINFSLFGYIILVFFMGFYISALNKFNSKAGTLSLVILTLTLVFLPRYDFATLLKSLIIYAVASIPLLMSGAMIKKP